MIREDLEIMKNEVKQLQKTVNQEKETSLAFEMLKELKANNKRKDITILVLIFVIIAMIIGFFVYESQFEIVEDSEQYIEDIENPLNTNFTQTIN